MLKPSAMLCLSEIFCVLRLFLVAERQGGDIVAPAGDKGSGGVQGEAGDNLVASAGD